MQTNGIVSGIGQGARHFWDYTQQGSQLIASGIFNRVNVTFDLTSQQDMSQKLKTLDALGKEGVCTREELQELREILRLYNNLEAGGSGERTWAGIGEQTETVYTDGVAKQVQRREKRIATLSQQRAAENARQYAHTEPARAKRRKSILARRDGKILGHI